MHKIFLALLVTLLFIGCGGSGDSNSNTQPATYDAAVSASYFDQDVNECLDHIVMESGEYALLNKDKGVFEVDVILEQPHRDWTFGNVISFGMFTDDPSPLSVVDVLINLDRKLLVFEYDNDALYVPYEKKFSIRVDREDSMHVFYSIDGFPFEHLAKLSVPDGDAVFGIYGDDLSIDAFQENKLKIPGMIEPEVECP